jgi:hypothetical protein
LKEVVSYLKAAPHRVVTKTSCMPVVELVALDDAEIKYSTVQNWYPGNKEGKGGVFNFVKKEESVRKCKNLMDASRNGFCCHLEISICYTKETIQLENFIQLLLPIIFNRLPEQNDSFR